MKIIGVEDRLAERTMNSTLMAHNVASPKMSQAPTLLAVPTTAFTTEAPIKSQIPTLLTFPTIVPTSMPSQFPSEFPSKFPSEFPSTTAIPTTFPKCLNTVYESLNLQEILTDILSHATDPELLTNTT